MTPARASAAVLLAAALSAGCGLALAGCGLGAGATPSRVTVLVTSGFGAHVLQAHGALKLRGQETVMSLLQRNYRVRAGDGGGFVESVDGLSGGQQAGQPVAWFYYVNGVEATRGAAATDVRSGDRIWWDRHDWSQTERVPAVVGSFPAPFLGGIAGARLPVRVECASIAGSACHTVGARLRALGLAVDVTALTAATARAALRVLVAPWVDLEAEPGADGLRHGPRASGVYARFSPDGRALTLLDQEGHRVQSLYAGAGLIAATRQGEDAPVWLVTGTDGEGVVRAAGHFDESTLRDHFAVALARNATIALPERDAIR